MIKIRLAQLNDFEKFKPVYKQFLKTVETSHPNFEEVGKQDYEGFIASKENYLAFAFQDDALVGFAEFGYLHKRFRDKEKGVS